MQQVKQQAYLGGVLKRKYMATNLFGPSPLELQQKQQATLQDQSMAYAQLTPLQRASQSLYQAGSNLGGGIAGMMGVQDPAMKRQSDIAAIVSKYDIANPEDLQKASQELMAAGFQQEASMAIGKANELSKAQADINQVKAKTQQEAAAAQAAQYKLDQEKLMTEELAALPDNRTDADILKIATKYGTPKDVFQVVQQSADKQAARDQALTLAREAAAAKIEAAKAAGANQLQLAQLTASTKMDIAQIMGGLRQQGMEDKKAEKTAKEEAQKAGVVASFEGALETIDRLAAHPGKTAAVGFGGKTTSMIPGTNAAGFASQLETFKAQVFLPQVQALKGMGALSDAEGKKMSAAVGALDQSMKPSEFDSQLSIIKNDLKKAKARVSGGKMPEPVVPSSVIPAASSDGWSIKPKGQ